MVLVKQWRRNYWLKHASLGLSSTRKPPAWHPACDLTYLPRAGNACILPTCRCFRCRSRTSRDDAQDNDATSCWADRASSCEDSRTASDAAGCCVSPVSVLLETYQSGADAPLQSMFTCSCFSAMRDNISNFGGIQPQVRPFAKRRVCLVRHNPIVRTLHVCFAR